LLRDDVLLRKDLPPVVYYLSQLFIRLRSYEIRASLGKLLVEIGRIDDRQHLTLFHMGANVVVPILHIAADPPVDAAGIKGAHVAGKDELAFARSSLRLHQSDGGNGLLIRPNLGLLLAFCAIGNAVDGKTDRGDGCNDAD
jgi:hypothetical protein